MPPWLRLLGLRVALLSGLIVTASTTAHAAGPPDLPALLASLDRAFSRVYDVAERKVAELEVARPAPPLLHVSALLDDFAGCVAQACDAAATALDVELAVTGSLSPERRYAALGCLERHLREARRDAARATDPAVRAEYEVTCERLRDVRRLL
jgi:hypothetical protein